METVGHAPNPKISGGEGENAFPKKKYWGGVRITARIPARNLVLTAKKSRDIYCSRAPKYFELGKSRFLDDSGEVSGKVSKHPKSTFIAFMLQFF